MRRWLAILVFLGFIVAVSSALARSDARTRFTVTSSLDGKKVLPLRIRWIAQPHTALPNVAEVDFLIDGQRAWTAHEPPYCYGAIGGICNRLVTSFLTPGTHTFTVRAVTIFAKTATHTVKAQVIASPSPPANLVGAWTRIVTPDDLKNVPPGPPPGPWTITISSIGWATGPGDNFDVRYLANGNVVMGPEVVTPTQQSGAFCGVDPLHTWTVVLSTDDQSMRLDPVGQDDCGDRVAIMQGTWTRVH